MIERYIMNVQEIKKKNGATVYRANIYLGVDRLTGKKTRTTITGRTKKEVKSKAREKQAEFQQNGCTKANRPSVTTYEDLAAIWWDNYKHTVKESTQVVVKGKMVNYLLPELGQVRIDKITPPLLQSIVNKWANEYNSNQTGLANYYSLNSLNKRILQYAVVLQLIPSNPARDVVVPRKATQDKKKIKYLDEQNIKKFLNYLDQLRPTFKNLYDTVFYKLLLATGLRIGEIQALEWQDIDFSAATLTVNKTLTRAQKVTSPKTEASYRVLNLDQKTLLMLRLYKNRQQEKAWGLGISPKTIFFTFVAEYPNYPTLCRRLKEHIEKAGIPPISFHAFRHTHASILLNSGLPYKELQHRLGHTTIAMTLDTYSHLSPDNAKKAVSFYEAALEKIQG